MSIEAEKSMMAQMNSSTTSKSDEVVSDVANLEAGSVVEVEDGMKRNLKGRHINMIAIAGMIVSHESRANFVILSADVSPWKGTGLFLSSGKSIARAGPVGALLSYIFMGVITSGVSFTSGEMSAFMPLTGGFVRHASRLVDPALGAALGWNFCKLKVES
jgi:amino acid transporter